MSETNRKTGYNRFAIGAVKCLAFARSPLERERDESAG